MAMNEQSQLYAANIYSASVVGFAKNAKGNATPIVTIAGSNTGLMKPFALAFNASGELLVADEYAGVLVFAKGANGNVAPLAEDHRPLGSGGRHGRFQRSHLGRRFRQ